MPKPKPGHTYRGGANGALIEVLDVTNNTVEFRAETGSKFTTNPQTFERCDLKELDQ